MTFQRANPAPFFIKERGTRRKVFKMYKTEWNHHNEEKATCETESYLNRHFPSFLGSTQVPRSLSLFIYPISG